jgi:hypothetical protein
MPAGYLETSIVAGSFYKRINPRLGDGIKLFVVSVAQSRRNQGESGQSGKKQGKSGLQQHNDFPLIWLGLLTRRCFPSSLNNCSGGHGMVLPRGTVNLVDPTADELRDDCSFSLLPFCSPVDQESKTVFVSKPIGQI